MSSTVARDAVPPAEMALATLGGGCFWCLEAVYDDLRGVSAVESGYMGGHVVDPTYEAVCDGSTGHIEVVRVTFDPKTVSYREILGVFFAIHDPTTIDQQGNDYGPQYASAIFTHSDEQTLVARAFIDAATRDRVFRQPIVTQVRPASTFYEAEDYHQEYYARVGAGNPYCSVVVAPKLAKFRKLFGGKSKGL
jgi:peptide-methionine (S)-S-oxide reductase